MSLATPEKIRILQRKLYRKAKAEPAFRFYVLYDKICREDMLRHGRRIGKPLVLIGRVPPPASATTAKISSSSHRMVVRVEA